MLCFQMVVRRLVFAFVSVVSLVPLTSACSQTANVDDLFMSLDADGSRRRTDFFTDTVSINCIAQMASSRADVTLEVLIRQTARFDFDQQQSLSANRVLAASELAPGVTNGATLEAVPLEKVDAQGKPSDALPYPAGSYTCEAYLDGQKQKTVNFDVQFPPCPDATILSGQPCKGFYRIDDKCPEFGASSTENVHCTCTANNLPIDPQMNPTGGNWVCEPPP
jgi:hypothetical protein